MRRPLLALAVLAGSLAAATQVASTAGNDLPASTTAVYRATTVNGATLLSMSYTVEAGRILAVKPELRGVGLLGGPLGVLPKTVTARFGSGTAVPCVITASSPLTGGLAKATYDCAVALPGELADRPRPLVIDVS